MNDPAPPPSPSWQRRAARAAYTAVLWALQPAYLARLWWRGRAEARYREAIGERFGHYPVRRHGPGVEGAPDPRPWIWLHAVSLGETRAAAALVAELRRSRPTMRLVLTHGTATGREAGAALLGPDDLQAWLPYDTPSAVQGFFAAFRPAVGVLMETEIWPNLLDAARRRSVPMVLANARLSERSRRKGQRLEPLLRPAVEGLALVLAQTEDDAQRLRATGATNVVVAGNVKFDMTPDPAVLARGRHWAVAHPRPIVLAVSTREGEEAPLLECWSRARAAAGSARGADPLAARQADPRLLVVPRHPQRFGEVAALLDRSGLAWCRRSEFPDGHPDEAALGADVWLGDSMGELPAYYAASRVALLGGSFAPLGGQNLIEAAACGCPVVMGPHTFNFELAAEMALEAGAAVRAADLRAAVAQAWSQALGSPAEASAARARAERFAAAHRGAARRMAERIVDLIPGAAGPRSGR
jgi:3-deoxy-D-manno-octulosonic-acid transferase